MIVPKSFYGSLPNNQIFLVPNDGERHAKFCIFLRTKNRHFNNKNRQVADLCMVIASINTGRNLSCGLLSDEKSTSSSLSQQLYTDFKYWTIYMRASEHFRICGTSLFKQWHPRVYAIIAKRLNKCEKHLLRKLLLCFILCCIKLLLVYSKQPSPKVYCYEKGTSINV